MPADGVCFPARALTVLVFDMSACDTLGGLVLSLMRTIHAVSTPETGADVVLTAARSICCSAITGDVTTTKAIETAPSAVEFFSV